MPRIVDLPIVYSRHGWNTISLFWFMYGNYSATDLSKMDRRLFYEDLISWRI